MLSRTVAAELAEGQMAGGLGRIEGDYEDAEIGSYPYYRQGRFGVSLVLRATDAARLDAARDVVAAQIRSLDAEPIDESAT